MRGSKKDKWADLPGEFKEAMAGADEARLSSTIRDAALYNEALLEQQRADQHLKEARFAATEANRGYRDGLKACRLKVAYCREILRSRGKATPGD